MIGRVSDDPLGSGGIATEARIPVFPKMPTRMGPRNRCHLLGLPGAFSDGPLCDESPSRRYGADEDVGSEQRRVHTEADSETRGFSRAQSPKGGKP